MAMGRTDYGRSELFEAKVRHAITFEVPMLAQEARDSQVQRQALAVVQQFIRNVGLDSIVRAKSESGADKLAWTKRTCMVPEAVAEKIPLRPGVPMVPQLFSLSHLTISVPDQDRPHVLTTLQRCAAKHLPGYVATGTSRHFQARSHIMLFFRSNCGEFHGAAVVLYLV